MSKVKRFSIEERYGYQNRKVIYDKNTDNDIELNNIYPIIDLINQLDEQISDLQSQLAEKDKEIEYQESMKILAVKNQNKKAIEQLEKIINIFEPYENENKDTILCANNGISFLEYIDQQIALLKGKVEDVKD